eukprot:CAMPEP_0182430680 /NCGR_PEP_ID=MMETSP1167-20130531/42496_1 /TAXON_ID=2988 /ORGANISM="Mallomonas Sp, Strain CCMP3275" /LENGTH=695 /DNA_ID=CAMNT_0024616055 /DNA_START=652 /DNA_END=2742 /DNA_ORIENTATION=+
MVPNDDICCTINMLAMFLFYVFQWIIYLHYDVSNSAYATPMFHSRRLYVLTGYVVIIIATNTRYMRTSIVLHLAKKEAETKRMLIGFFSHEIRTPLNSVLMGLQVAEQEVKGGGRKLDLLPLFDEMRCQCDLAVDILNDLLLYERLEEGIMDLHFKPVSIKHFLQTKIKTFAPICEEKGVEIKLTFLSNTREGPLSDYTIEKSYCRGDEDKLSQVIRTLMRNAIECTPRGKSVSVTVELLSEEEAAAQIQVRRMSWQPGMSRMSMISTFPEPVSDKEKKFTVRIRIHDEGNGIPQEEQETIFTNALSFNAGVLHARQGKGLGLWISHSIITLHRGDLNVWSTGEGEGNGSTFTIELPAHFHSASGRVLFSQTSSCEDISHWFHRSSHIDSNSSGSSSISGPDIDLLEMMSDKIFRSFRGNAAIYPNASTRPTTRLGRSSERRTPMSPAPKGSMSPMRGSLSPVKGSISSMKAKVTKSTPVETMNTIHSHMKYSTSINEEDEKSDDCRQRISSEGTVPDYEVEDIEDYQAKEIFIRDQLNKSSYSHSNSIPSIVSPVTRRVLVVDDASMNRKMLCRLLVGHCDVTVEAEDGQVAVEKMKSSIENETLFSLVLIDYQMPNMDGPTAASCMRELGYRGPIIGVTGNSLAVHVKTFITQGADRVVFKPLNFTTLTRTLMELGCNDALEITPRVTPKKQL